jgi:hypothetical protein
MRSSLLCLLALTCAFVLPSVTALSDELRGSSSSNNVTDSGYSAKLNIRIEQITNGNSSTEQLLENDLLKTQLRASEQREAVLRAQLVQALDHGRKKEASLSSIPRASAFQPLRTGVQMTYTLPCGAKAELCLHKDGRWFVHEYHKKRTISRQVLLRNVPTERSTLFTVLGDGVTSVYQTTLGNFEIVIQ